MLTLSHDPAVVVTNAGEPLGPGGGPPCPGEPLATLCPHAQQGTFGLSLVSHQQSRAVPTHAVTCWLLLNSCPFLAWLMPPLGAFDVSLFV